MVSKCNNVRITGSILLVLNSLGMVYGIFMIIQGSWFLTTQTSFIDLTKVIASNEDIGLALSKSSVLQQCYYILVTSGVIAIFSYILGILGPCKRNSYCLIAFIVMLIVLIGLEVAAGLIAFVHNYQVRHYLHGFLHQIYGLIKTDQDIEKSWIEMMKKLTCCGISNHTDYSAEILPAVCCGSDRNLQESWLPSDKNCTSTSIPLAYEGCYSRLEDWLTYHLILLTEIILSMVILQITTLIVSFIFSYRLKKEILYKRQAVRTSLTSTSTIESSFK